MPTSSAFGFAVRGVAWSLGLFALLRMSWTEAQVVLPVTQAQGGLAQGLFGVPVLPVEVSLACSGADALALCAGAVLAYPARWRARLAGAGVGVALVLALNTVRIGTLGQAVAYPTWFNVLHVYLWPALLTLAIAGFVFTWMRVADRARLTSSPADVASAQAEPAAAAPLQPTRRFVVTTGLFLLLFAVAAPLYHASAQVLALAGFIAHAAAAVLGAIGVTAHATANVLWTSRGGFLVTQECVTTPLIPIYLAAVTVFAPTWPRLVAGVLAAVPLFTALGIVRVLVVALPDAIVASPLVLVHAFYQLLLGAVVVVLAAWWRHGRGRSFRRAAAGIALGAAFIVVLGPAYTTVVAYPAAGTVADPQGAIALLPAFQVGLYIALCVAASLAVGWKVLLGGVAVLALTQAAGLIALDALASYDIAAHARDVRAWAVAGPILLVAAAIRVTRPARG